MHVYISEEINGDKHSIKLKGVVGMAVPKGIQMSIRYHHIHAYGVSRPSLLTESIDSMQTILTFLIFNERGDKECCGKKRAI